MDNNQKVKNGNGVGGGNDSIMISKENTEKNDKNPNISVCVSFIGTLPSYIVECIYQIRLFFQGDIYIITNDTNSRFIQKIKNMEIFLTRTTTMTTTTITNQKTNGKIFIIDYETVISNKFIQTIEQTRDKFVICSNLPGREELFIRSFERFFLLQNLMKLKNINNCLFMEIDNLIYDDPENWYINVFSKNTCDLSYMYDDEKRCSSGIMYVKNPDSLNGFLEFCINYILTSDEYMSEMTALSNYYKLVNDKIGYNEANKTENEPKRETNPKKETEIQLLPTFWKNDNTPIKTYKYFDDFGSDCIFDSAPIGIYLCGTEPAHTFKKINFKVRWGFSHIDYTIYKFKWEYDDNGRKIPFIYSPDLDKWLRINNLHIHSKLLVLGLSKPVLMDMTLPKTNLLKTPKKQLINYEEVITGERIQFLADVYFGSNITDFLFNPNINPSPFSKSSKCLLLENLEENNYYENPKICFCYTHCIHHLSTKIHLFKNKFILITHNSDTNIEDTIITNKILNCPNLVAWYSQNVKYNHHKLFPVPIGLANSQWDHGIQTYKSVLNNYENEYEDEDDDNMKEHSQRQNLFYFHFRHHTNPEKREECYNILKDTPNIHFLQELPPTENIHRIATYKYCICPEGNGEDTHRIWEAIYLKTIPIMLERPFSRILAEKLNIPIILLNNWDILKEEKTQKDLEKMYYEIFQPKMQQGIIMNEKIKMTYYKTICDNFRNNNNDDKT